MIIIPIYQYKCPNCGYIFEVMKQYQEEDFELCPQCHNFSYKIISPYTFRLYGKDWYKANEK